MRAGLDGQALASLGDGDTALIDACRLVARLGQAAPPGQDWAYYNGNYYLAGAALAALRGTTFETALGEQVLRPAGMGNTSFQPPGDHARGHHQGRVVDEDYPRARRPSGGLWSTAADLLSFAEFVLADAQLLAAMRAPSTGTAAPVQYGLGWALAPGLMFHNGRLDGFRSILLVAPEHQYGAVMVVNSTDALPAIAGFLDGLQARLTGSARIGAADVLTGTGPAARQLARLGRPVKMPGGGAGEDSACSSVTGCAPAANRSRSPPWTTRPGNGSAAARRASAATGKPRCAAASTRLPNLRPRSTAASAIRQACGKTEHTVATCARAYASGGPSPIFTAYQPAGLSARATAAANSADVRCAGCAPRRTGPLSPHQRTHHEPAQPPRGRRRSGSAGPAGPGPGRPAPALTQRQLTPD